MSTNIAQITATQCTLLPVWLGSLVFSSIVYSDLGSLLMATLSAIFSISPDASPFASRASLKSVLAAYTRTTVMRFLVSVPVLSEQMVVALPIVSHAASTLHMYIHDKSSAYMYAQRTAQGCCPSSSS